MTGRREELVIPGRAERREPGIFCSLRLLHEIPGSRASARAPE
jgi:hypothetical protein